MIRKTRVWIVSLAEKMTSNLFVLTLAAFSVVVALAGKEDVPYRRGSVLEAEETARSQTAGETRAATSAPCIEKGKESEADNLIQNGNK